MKKIPFNFYRILNVILLAVPFIWCWEVYYETRTLTVGSRQVYVLVCATFLVICYMMCRKMDVFNVSVATVGEVIFGQILSLCVTDFCMYVVIWMVSIHAPNPKMGFVAFAIQIVIAVIWSFVMQRKYFASHPQMHAAVVYDEREGLENLIHAYGLEKRYSIDGTLDAAEVADDPSVLNEYEAVFLCGVRSSRKTQILKHCVSSDIKLFIMPEISDILMRASEPIHMLHLPILKSEKYDPPFEFLVVKRAVDIVLSALAIVLFSPLMLVIAIAVASDGGPIIYRQKRLTKDGRIFEIYKFRSMKVGAENESGAVLSEGDQDRRVTRVGRVIREWRLDELPQLVNILKGDMSIVGPRPERPELQSEIEKEIPEFGLRLHAKAGLTGYAQVYGKYNTTFYDKLLMDLMYMAKPSIFEDFAIMLATLRIIPMKESSAGTADRDKILEYRGTESKQ